MFLQLRNRYHFRFSIPSTATFTIQTVSTFSSSTPCLTTVWWTKKNTNNYDDDFYDNFDQIYKYKNRRYYDENY